MKMTHSASSRAICSAELRHHSRTFPQQDAAALRFQEFIKEEKRRYAPTGPVYLRCHKILKIGKLATILLCRRTGCVNARDHRLWRPGTPVNSRTPGFGFGIAAALSPDEFETTQNVFLLDARRVEITSDVQANRRNDG